MFTDPKPKLFACRATRGLGSKISDHFGQALGESQVMEFKDGEFSPCIDETVRGDVVFILQSTFAPSDNLMELLMMVDAAKRASAYKVVAVIPYFGFARQDRKDRPRVSITAKMVANLIIASGADRVMTMDLHADQLQGFFDVPVDHLYASKIFVPYIEQLGLDNLAIASPDTGGSKRANAYAKQFGADLVICHKFRRVPNEVERMEVIGNTQGKNVILIDDLIDTGGSIAKAAEIIIGKGAKSVRVFATHPVLSGNAIRVLEQSAIEKIYVTDTIPIRRESEKIEVISVAPMFAEMIRRVFENKSISNMFIMS